MHPWRLRRADQQIVYVDTGGPPPLLSPSGAAQRLASFLVLAGTDGAAAAALTRAARGLAVSHRVRGDPPERAIVALKEVFVRVDGNWPFLLTCGGLRAGDEARLSHQWYPTLLRACVAAYYSLP